MILWYFHLKYFNLLIMTTEIIFNHNDNCNSNMLNMSYKKSFLCNVLQWKQIMLILNELLTSNSNKVHMFICDLRSTYCDLTANIEIYSQCRVTQTMSCLVLEAERTFNASKLSQRFNKNTCLASVKHSFILTSYYLGNN